MEPLLALAAKPEWHCWSFHSPPCNDRSKSLSARMCTGGRYSKSDWQKILSGLILGFCETKLCQNLKCSNCKDSFWIVFHILRYLRWSRCTKMTPIKSWIPVCKMFQISPWVENAHSDSLLHFDRFAFFCHKETFPSDTPCCQKLFHLILFVVKKKQIYLSSLLGTSGQGDFKALLGWWGKG